MLPVVGLTSQEGVRSSGVLRLFADRQLTVADRIK